MTLRLTQSFVLKTQILCCQLLLKSSVIYKIQNQFLASSVPHRHTQFTSLCQSSVQFQAYHSCPLFLIGQFESLSLSDTSNGLPWQESKFTPIWRDVWWWWWMDHLMAQAGCWRWVLLGVGCCWRLSAGLGWGHSMPGLISFSSVKSWMSGHVLK